MIRQCSTELLTAALAGSLPPDDEDSLQRHLDECEACAAAMEQMAGGPAWCQEAAAMLHGEPLGDAMRPQDEWSEVDFTVEHLEPSDEPNVLGRLGGYDVLEIIGRGGMGVVLKAFDRELKRCVAIKVLAPHLAHNSLAKKRFAREAQAAAAVVHPHVLAIHHVQPNGRLPFLVMPLVAGESLAQRLKVQGTLELKEILRIGMQAAAGLGAAHDQGLVHRDVKPANILLEMGVERAVLTDFGLARAADDVSMTRWGIIAGTPQYMSPEQAKGEPLDGRSDLFSLGCVLYEMATGVSPFRTESVMATMRRLVEVSPQAMASVNPELPPWFIAIVDRLLEKEPSRRFGSAKEVSELLEGCLAHLQQPASVPLPATLPKPSPKPKAGRRKSRLIGIIAMIAILGLGSLAWIMLHQGDPAGEISFGPVIERILEPCVAPDFPALNLDAGNIVNSGSSPNVALFGAREAWREMSGAHLFVTPARDGFRAFGFVELRAISSRLWDQASVPASAVLTITASTDSGELRFSNTPDPATYAFKTRKGAFGLLQLLPTRDDVKGIKIRYKLALPNADEPDAGLGMAEKKDGVLGTGDIELVAMAKYPTKGSPWWKPDGSPLDKSPVDANDIHITSNRDPKVVWLTALFRVPGGLDTVVGKDSIQRVDGGKSLWAGRQFVNGKPATDLVALAVAVPSDAKQMDLALRVAHGAWQTAATVDAVDLLAKGELTQDGKTWHIEREGRDLVLKVESLPKDMQHRVVLHRKEQFTIAVPQYSQSDNPEGIRGTALIEAWQFKDVGAEGIHSFILQTRPYKKIEFRNIALQPDEDPAKDNDDLTKLKGEWEVVSVKGDGYRWRETKVGDRIDIAKVRTAGGPGQGKEFDYYLVSPLKAPKEFDVVFWVRNLFARQHGIYELDGDRLTLCVAPHDGARPTKFVAEAKKSSLIVLKRVVPAKKSVTGPEKFIGRVVAVSKDAKSFSFEGTARERPEEAVKFEVKVGEKTAITYSAVTTGGAKPTQGYLVWLQMDDDAKGLATEISFSGKQGGYRFTDVTGIVKAVDKDGKGITLQAVTVEGVEVGRENQKNVSIRFNEKTAFRFDEVAEGGARIEENQNAWIWYDDDARTSGNRIAGEVHVYGNAHPSSSLKSDISGKLASADKKSLTIAQEIRGKEPEKLIVKIDEKTSFLFHQVGPGGAKRAVGQGVGIWLRKGTKDTASDVAFAGVAPERWVTIRGKVVSVSDDRATITLEQLDGENPKRVEIKLTNKTRTAYFNVHPDGARPTVGYVGGVRLFDGSKDTAAYAWFERRGP